MFSSVDSQVYAGEPNWVRAVSDQLDPNHRHD